jgi:hypothetical protein
MAYGDRRPKVKREIPDDRCGSKDRWGIPDDTGGSPVQAKPITLAVRRAAGGQSE